MKNFFLFAVLLVSLTSCTQSTPFGKCIGLMDSPEPGLDYNLSLWNGAVAIFFSGTLVVPVYTLAKDIQCPVGKK